MSYRLEPHETVPQSIRRVMTEQVDKARHSLTTTDEALADRIHDARKRFKKIRAVLRLVRDDIGAEVYQRENVCYRDAGRQLAPLRESTVAVVTLDSLTGRYADELAAGAFDDLRAQLVAQQEAIGQQMLDEGVVDEVTAIIHMARTRIADLPVTATEFASLRDGLKRVYKRGYRGLDRAYTDPQPANFHEWRKRVKYLWYHTRLLKLVWPDMQDELADAVHTLADYLGDAHDLAEFRALVGHPDVALDRTQAQALDGLAERWQQELEAAARPLGTRIYTEKPGDFVGRMAAYWAARELEPAYPVVEL